MTSTDERLAERAKEIMRETHEAKQRYYREIDPTSPYAPHALAQTLNDDDYPLDWFVKAVRRARRNGLPRTQIEHAADEAVRNWQAENRGAPAPSPNIWKMQFS